MNWFVSSYAPVGTPVMRLVIGYAYAPVWCGLSSIVENFVKLAIFGKIPISSRVVSDQTKHLILVKSRYLICPRSCLGSANWAWQFEFQTAMFDQTQHFRCLLIVPANGRDSFVIGSSKLRCYGRGWIRLVWSVLAHLVLADRRWWILWNYPFRSTENIQYDLQVRLFRDRKYLLQIG